MTDTLKMIGYDILKTSAGVFVASSLDLPDKLDFGNSFVARNLSAGTIYFGVSDVVDYFSGNNSKLVSMNYKGVIDDVLFFSALSGVADVVKADEMMADLASKLSTDTKFVNTLVDASIVSTGRILGSFIDNQGAGAGVLYNLKHPSRLLNY